MFNRIETLRMAGALVSHGAERQRIIASNISNADTPSYRTKDLDSFSASFNSLPEGGMRATNPLHLTASGWGMGGARTLELPTEPNPNGNTVSLEEEVFKIADARREFDLALTITKSSLGMIRTSLGRRG